AVGEEKVAVLVEITGVARLSQPSGVTVRAVSSGWVQYPLKFWTERVQTSPTSPLPRSPPVPGSTIPSPTPGKGRPGGRSHRARGPPGSESLAGNSVIAPVVSVRP